VKVCKDDGVPTAGNAAGNTEDFLDLTGQVQPPANLPSGSVLPFPPSLHLRGNTASPLSLNNLSQKLTP
jgi:hypothetical protein